MTALVDMLVPALALGGLALAALHALGGAPPRLRRLVALVGLAAWVVPWPLLRVPLGLAHASIAPGIEPIADLALAPRAAAAWAAAPGWPIAVFMLLLVPGLVAFARDWSAFRHSTRALRRASRPAETLRTLLPAALRGTRVEIRTVPGTRTALAAGALRPTIWIGDAFASDADLELALTHECEHVRGHDPLVLTLVTLVGRAYAWNPLVTALAREAELMTEAACDRRCAARLGHARYVDRLAGLMLDADAARAPRLVAAARGTGLDIERLEWLCRRARLRVRDTVLVAALALAGAAAAGSRLVEPARPDWSRVAVPDTPAGRALTALVDAFERGDTELLATYLGAYTPQQVAWPFADFTRGVELLEILASEPRRIEYLVRDGPDGAVVHGRLELAAHGSAANDEAAHAAGASNGDSR